MPLKPVARQSLSDAVYDQLSSEIVHGRMEAGTPLPSERHLCDMLRVNRGAIREALKRLSQADLVSIQHGGSARVLNFKQTANLDLLTRLLFRPDGTIDLRVARSAMEMRAAMAPDIARLCARRREPVHANQLADLDSPMSKHPDDLLELQLLALQFWNVLAVGSGNIAYRRELFGRNILQCRRLLVEVLLQFGLQILF